MDAATAGILGTVSGGLIGVLITFSSNRAAAKRERTAFARSYKQQQIEQVRNVYIRVHHTMNATHDDNLPKIDGYEVAANLVFLTPTSMIDDVLKTLRTKKHHEGGGIQALISRMKKHLETMEQEFLSLK